MSHDQPLKAFHDNECECYGMTDIKAGGFFGIGIMGAVLKHIGIKKPKKKTISCFEEGANLLNKPKLLF